MAGTTCKDHTPCPEGYIQWHAWAREKAKTHKQVRCEECGRYQIWVPKKRRAALARSE